MAQSNLTYLWPEEIDKDVLEYMKILQKEEEKEQTKPSKTESSSYQKAGSSSSHLKKNFEIFETDHTFDRKQLRLEQQEVIGNSLKEIPQQAAETSGFKNSARELTSLNERIKELQDYTKHLIFDNARLCTEKTSVEQRLTELQHLQKEKNKIEKQSRMYHETRIKLASTQSDLKRVKKEFDNTNKQVSKLKSQVEIMESKKENLQKEITSLLSSKRAYGRLKKAGGNTCPQLHQEYENRISVLESEKIVLQAEIDSFRESFLRLQRQKLETEAQNMETTSMEASGSE